MLAGMSYLTQQNEHMNVAAHVPLWQTAANSNMFVLTGGNHVWNNMTRLNLWLFLASSHISFIHIAHLCRTSQPQGVTQLLSTTRYVVCSLTDVALCSVSISCTLQHLLWLCDARQHDSTRLLVGLLNLGKVHQGWLTYNDRHLYSNLSHILLVPSPCMSEQGWTSTGMPQAVAYILSTLQVGRTLHKGLGRMGDIECTSKHGWTSTGIP